MAISRKQLLKELLPYMNAMFGREYDKLNKPEYKMRPVYGKYSIYEYRYGEKVKRIAKSLTKAEAEGFMKLLKESDDE